MKRIYAITIVKNEGDIIESFLRYNLTYLDGILVYEGNSSFDNTADILKKMIAEGLNIHMACDLADLKSLTSIKSYDDLRKAMAKRAVDNFEADLIIPLDADEFLCHTAGINPREALEALQGDTEYRIPWRTYAYQSDPENYQEFLPIHFSHYRNPQLETISKALVSRFILEVMSISFTPGCHHLVYPGGRLKKLPVETPAVLRYNHFPIRSRQQLFTKTIINRIHKWKTQSYNISEKGFQIGLLYNNLKDNGEISIENMKLHSIKYSVHEEHYQKVKSSIKDALLIEGSMDVSYCTDSLVLRYTDYNVNDRAFIRGLLTEIDSTVTYLLNERHGKDEIDVLNAKIEEIYNSNTWKAGSFIKKIYRLLNPFKG